MSTPASQHHHSTIPPTRRLHSHWNIGLDFGTAFTKCVVRRSGQECYVVPFETGNGLLPSELLVGGDSLWLPTDASSDPALKRVMHLKMALAESACGKLGNTWLREFCGNGGLTDAPVVAARIENLTTYFLARVVAKARDFICQKTPGFGEVQGDRLTANLAIPISHEEETNVASTFQRCFRKAWLLAAQPGLEGLASSEIEAFLEKQRERLNEDLGCYIYPEVSANVQSYIKSRAGSDGLYLFADVGAGTVDLSVFIYYTHPTNDRPISYVAAGVIPLGSSQIEIRAACRVADRTLSVLKAAGIPLGSDGLLRTKLQEIIRLGKEGQRIDQVLFQEMQAAQKSIENDLYHREAPIIESARRKFRQGSRTSAQWGTLKLLIGGGGANAPLYQNAINQWFKQVSHFEPPRKQIPLPPDLNWPADLQPANHANAFRRFAVAHGLSFDRANLEDHRFPKDVRPIPQRPSSPPVRHHAPTKEEC